MLDPVELGKAMAAIVNEKMAPLLRRIDELEAKQADPVEVDLTDIVKQVMGSDDMRQLVSMETEAFLSANPPQKGDKGDTGDDGAGIADLLVDRDGKLIATFTDGRMKDLGPVIGKDGENGKDGRDGADLTEVGLEFDGERTVTVKGRTGEVSKRLPIPLWRGYWSEGVVAERGDILTHNGTAYIAVVDNPKCEPGVGKYDHEWKVFARKGRDGKDGRNGIDRTKPVDLKKKPGDE